MGEIFDKPYREERPWGSFLKFTENKKSTVKIITVNAGEAFSLQHHQNREERWHIISGSGFVTVGEEKFPVEPGKEFLIKPEIDHRVEAGNENVVFLEVAVGEFSEEDIVRIKDKYGRT